jgi:predicted permease
MPSIYVVSIVRLIVFPLIFIGLIAVTPLEMIIPAEMITTAIVCTIVSLSMPLGLSPIIIPSAYGKDTSVAAGATIASHVISCFTIPVMFYLMNLLI